MPAIKITDALVTIGVVLAIMSIPPYCFFTEVLTPLDNERFDSVEWKNAWPEDRGHMAKDLVTNHIHPGMTREALLELLGEPGSSMRASWYGRHPEGSVVALKYDIGSWLIGAPGDDSYVLVYLDGAGVVTGARIDGV